MASADETITASHVPINGVDPLERQVLYQHINAYSDTQSQDLLLCLMANETVHFMVNNRGMKTLTTDQILGSLFMDVVSQS